ncbi:MAG: hypothetical protein DRJ52_05050 [Thermoprotei archaeon]|nr:MAG: hypothetical protein DRJ52_05050 [Thermoprotei archaeon]
MVRLYKVSFKVISPLIVSKRVGFRGFSYEVEKYIIHGSLVRGALLTKMLEKGEDPSVVNRLALSPDYAITPFIATDKKGTLYLNTLLAHSLCFSTKKKIGGLKPVFSHSIENLLTKLYVGRELEEVLASIFKENLAKQINTSKTWLMPGEVKPCLGSPIVKKNDIWYIPSVETDVSIEVALDHSRGSSVPAMLYAYEHVSEGTVYTGFIAVNDNSRLNTLLSEKEFTLSIGRGTSRGFGKVLAVAEEVRIEEFAHSLSELLSQQISENDYVVLEIISPLFTVDPLPLPLKLGQKIPVPSLWLKKLGFSLNCKAELEVVSILGGYTRYQGWSMRNKAPKLPIRGIAPGSLIITRVSSVTGNLTEALPLLAFTGLDQYASQGFNIVLPLQKDFIQVKPWEVKL